MSSKPRTLAAWLAVAAIALQVLWPLVAQARPSSVTRVPVCTVDGVTHYLELKGAESPLEKRTASHHEHCAFCSFHSGRTAALPSAPGFPLPLSTAVTPAGSLAVSVASLHRLPAARPRAPPAVS